MNDSAFSIVIEFGMVKKHCLLLFVGLSLLCSVNGFSQGREYFAYPVQHRYGVYVSGAYDIMLPIGISNLSIGHGQDVAVGLIYEYNNKHLLINGGIGFAFENNKLKLADAIQQKIDTVDAQNNPFQLNTEMTRADRPRIWMLDIPINVGQTFGKFYYMGGVRVGIKFSDKSTVNGTIASLGDYDRYIEAFQGIAEAGFRKVKFSDKANLFLTYNMRLSAEGGLNLHQFDGNKYIVYTRLGLFVNAGVFLPTVKLNTNAFTLPEGSNPYNFRSYNYESLLQKGNKLIGDIQVGLKFSVLLMDKKLNGNCRTCAKPFQKAAINTRCIACEEQDRRRAIKALPKKESKTANGIKKQMQFREDHRR